MSEPIPLDRTEPPADSPPAQGFPAMPIDLASLIDQCVAGAIGLIGKLARTFLWMLFRPVALSDRLVQPDFAKTFCPPLAFLVLGILCGFAVMHDVWTLSPESVARLGESETGWVAWIAQTLIDDLSGLSLSMLIVRTLPTALVTVLVAFFASRCLAARENSSALAAAICLVIGFKLLLRFGQALWQLALVWFSKMGPSVLPATVKFELVMQVAMYTYFAAIAYIFFFAGTRFLAAIMRRHNRGWLSAWPASLGIAGGVSSLLFLGTYIAPQTAWNVVQAQHIDEDVCLLKAVPLGPARLDFRDGNQVFLTSTVLLRNETDRQVLLALPRQITVGEVAEPIECQYESDSMLDGTCLLDRGSARVVRATWRLKQPHMAVVAQESSVPLIIQLGSVDDVMREQVQSSTLPIALDPGLLADFGVTPRLQTAEAERATVDR